MDDTDHWFRRARCHGRVDLFFPPHGERPPARHRREAEAKGVCGPCPVRVTCRTHARRVGEIGIWGGENDEERLASGAAVLVPTRFGRTTLGEAAP